MTAWVDCANWKNCGSAIQGKPHQHQPGAPGLRWGRYPPPKANKCQGAAKCGHDECVNSSLPCGKPEAGK